MAKMSIQDVARLSVLHHKYVSLHGEPDVDHIRRAIDGELRAAEAGRIHVTRGLLRELRADRAVIGRIAGLRHHGDMKLGISGRRTRRHGNARRSMTFGVIPPYDQFVAQIRSIDPEEGRPYLPAGKTYTIEAHAGTEEARLLQKAHINPVGHGDYGKLRWELSDRQLYAFIKKLTAMGREDADMLASDIMGTLGYEWI